MVDETEKEGWEIMNKSNPKISHLVEAIKRLKVDELKQLRLM